MSRVGKRPVIIPSGVKAEIKNGQVSIEGPKGKLSFTHARGIKVALDSGSIVVEPILKDAQSKSDYGTVRSRIQNMVDGVTKGFKRNLELNGVGFVAKVQGQKLVLSVGFSHDVELEIPKLIKCVVVKNTIEMECPDPETLGTFASVVRKTQPPEPYLGKGIKYSDEVVRRKAGKTGKK